MSISVQNISKQYGEQFAVKNVSFSIPKGQTCGFLGPNGAGKSTTLKIITGFLHADEGEVYVNDIDIAQQPLQAKQQIGYLPEHNALYLDLYVKEFLGFVADVHQINNKKEAIEQVIEQTGLEKEAHKQIGQLSKGYKQRVGLAQALIHKPSVLILDEPLSGLDPNQLHDLRELISELGKEKTVIFSSHILQEVEQVANRILLIKDGELVFDETKNKQAKHIVYVAFEEVLSQEQLQDLEVLGSIKQVKNGYQVKSETKDLAKQLYQFAVHNNLTLVQLQPIEEELTTIFKNKTSQK